MDRFNVKNEIERLSFILFFESMIITIGLDGTTKLAVRTRSVHHQLLLYNSGIDS